MSKDPTEARRHGPRVRLLAGDITQVSLEAVVNAANSALAGSRGVDGAIRATAEPVSAVRQWLSAHPGSGITDMLWMLRGTDVMAVFRGAITETQRETK